MNLLVKRNANTNEIRIKDKNEISIIDLSNKNIHEQIRIAHSLRDWKNNGYRGTPEI